jgi:putative transposase
MIQEKYRIPIEKYMSGIVSKNQSKLLAIYCNPDHVHLLIGLHPAFSISEMARDIKASSSKWINEELIPGKIFRWQRGFGAFSYSKSQIHRVGNYINNQAEHHRKTTFHDEYVKLLKKFEIEYKDQYLFKG